MGVFNPPSGAKPPPPPPGFGDVPDAMKWSMAPFSELMDMTGASKKLSTLEAAKGNSTAPNFANGPNFGSRLLATAQGMANKQGAPAQSNASTGNKAEMLGRAVLGK